MWWELIGLAIAGLILLSAAFWGLLFAAIPLIVLFALGVAAVAVVGALLGVALGLLGALGGLVWAVITAGGPLLLIAGLGFLLWTATGRRRLARVRVRAIERKPRCQECRREVPKDAAVCPHCTADLWANCPECGRIYRVGVRFCPDCGRSLRLKPSVSSRA
jgi:RNA polymerase subunit RPABC4/transcription elongation factor Spt4